MRLLLRRLLLRSLQVELFAVDVAFFAGGLGLSVAAVAKGLPLLGFRRRLEVEVAVLR